MNVSKMTKAQLVELYTKFDAQLVQRTRDLVAITAKCEALVTENAQLRELNAQWAHQSRIDSAKISRLKAQLPSVTVDSFTDRCRSYCSEHGVRSVPGDVVRQWRTQA